MLPAEEQQSSSWRGRPFIVVVQAAHMMLRWAVAAVTLAATTTLSVAPSNASASISTGLVGSGPSHAALALHQWAADLPQTTPGWSFSYAQTSDHGGLADLATGSADFAVTDRAPTDAELAAIDDPADVAVIPIEAEPLVFSAGPTFVFPAPIDANRICSSVTTINHAPFTRSFVARSDASGANVAVSDFCIHQAPSLWDAYRAGVAADPTMLATAPAGFTSGSPISTFPAAGVSLASGADGVANTLANPALLGSVEGVVERGRAQERGLQIADLTGGTTAHSAADGTVTNALNAATVRPDSTLSTGAVSPDDAYPLVTVDYLVARLTPGDPAVAARLRALIDHGLGDGQRRLPSLGYLALPPRVLTLAASRAAAIGSSGPPPPVVSESPSTPLLLLAGLTLAAIPTLKRRRKPRG